MKFPNGLTGTEEVIDFRLILGGLFMGPHRLCRFVLNFLRPSLGRLDEHPHDSMRVNLLDGHKEFSEPRFPKLHRHRPFCRAPACIVELPLP